MRVLTTWRIGHHTVRAGLVTTEAERLACLRLRYREYHDVQGSIADHPERLDIDWADANSTMLCTTLDGDPAPIGTMRLIHCEHGCLLTRGYDGRPAVFSGVDYALPERCPLTGRTVRAHETVEGSRYVARLITLADGQRIVHSNLLLEAAMRWCRDRGVQQIIGAMREHQWWNLRQDGLPMTETISRVDGQPHQYHDMDYREVLIPVSAMAHAFRRTLATPAPAANHTLLRWAA